jgi:hypothetical protein
VALANVASAVCRNEAVSSRLVRRGPPGARVLTERVVCQNDESAHPRYPQLIPPANAAGSPVTPAWRTKLVRLAPRRASLGRTLDFRTDLMSSLATRPSAPRPVGGKKKCPVCGTFSSGRDGLLAPCWSACWLPGRAFGCVSTVTHERLARWHYAAFSLLRVRPVTAQPA